MSDRLNITRRDFLNGIALGTLAGGSVSPLDVLAAKHVGGLYPPLLTGMRGNHPGSFEVAHSVAWYGATFPRPEVLCDEVYDLVVVGGGISGLAAAFFHQQQAGFRSKVLVLDNHDDFGSGSPATAFTAGRQPRAARGFG
jgi:spermidine dehydrogenase